MKTLNLLLLTVILGILFVTSGQAQEQKKHVKKSYTDAEGNLYWNKALPFRIWISVDNSSEKILLESKEASKYVNPSYFDTEGPNFIRTRWEVDTVTKKTIYPQKEIRWPVITDGTPPIVKIHYSATSKNTINGTTYYGKGLSVELTAKDNFSGVEAIYYSINGQAYTEYKGKIVLDKNGDFNLKYYAVDNVGNAGKIKGNNDVNFSISTDAPITEHQIIGIAQNEVISMKTKIKLNVKASKAGTKATYYSIDGGKKQIYNRKNVPVSMLKNGDHTLTYYSIDNVNNIEQEKTFNFYLDKLAPILTSDVLGDRYIVNDRIYFSGRTKLKLTAVDNKSGIDKTMYSIDGSEFKEYTEPFYLPSIAGIHIIRYYAIDKMNNNTSGTRSVKYEEYNHKVEKIYVDLTGPTLSHKYIGKVFKTRDTVFINKKTQIMLIAYDKESGTDHIAYSFDGDQAEIEYERPFSIDKSGLHTLEYFGYDKVNNRNIGKIFFFGDNEGPVPAHNFSIKSIGNKEGLEVYPAYVQLYISATDEMIGTQNIYYSINGKPEMKLTKLYVQGFMKGKINTVNVRAVDKLGNQTETEIKFFVE